MAHSDNRRNGSLARAPKEPGSAAGSRKENRDNEAHRLPSRDRSAVATYLVQLGSHYAVLGCKECSVTDGVEC
jgi:hypothetical protein